MGINTAISRIVHLCAQNCEFLLPPYMLAQTHSPQRDIHAHNGDTQGQSKEWGYSDKQDYSWLLTAELVDKINCVF